MATLEDGFGASICHPNRPKNLVGHLYFRTNFVPSVC